MGSKFCNLNICGGTMVQAAAAAPQYRKDTWEFAHKYCGKLWLKLGVGLVPISILPLLLFFGKDITTIGIVGGIVCCVQIIPLVVSLISTENALKNVFDKNGRRKDKNSV